MILVAVIDGATDAWILNVEVSMLLYQVTVIVTLYVTDFVN